MSDLERRRNPVEEMAEDFLERYRRGERPSLSEYTRRSPELAEEIRDLFPALVMMEEVVPAGAAKDPSSIVTEHSIPERLGDYRILREVGRGGMGIVYEAEQETLGRHVALKVLPFQAQANPTRLQRFRREARSAARLHHTNIVPVFDVGEWQGTCYYAMQFIRGQGLDEVLAELKHLRAGRRAGQGGAVTADAARTAGRPATLSLAHGLLSGEFSQPAFTEEGVGVEASQSSAAPTRTPAPDISSAASAASSIFKSPSDSSSAGESHYFRSTARIALQVAEALAYAHGQKVLHRDIKPANLLLDFQGVVWVTDFGLAKEEGEDLTQTGDVVGTLRYMAPERFNGTSDPRSDIYSLGLTLYELVTLRAAYDEADRGRLIRCISHEEPTRPRRLRPSLPRDLETIVLKAIAKEPRQRYASAEAMAEDLRRFLADRPIRARRSAAWEHAWRWCRRNRLLAILSAAVLLLGVVVGVGVPVAAFMRAERDRAVAAEAEAHSERDRAVTAEKAAQKAEGEVQFRSHLAQAAVYRQSGEPGQHFKSFAEVKRALELARAFQLGPKALAEVRNEAIASLCLPDLQVAEEWAGCPLGTSAVALDPSFRLYARSNYKGTISVRRRRDDLELSHIPGADLQPTDHELRFSPDGRFLQQTYLTYPRRARLWRLAASGAIEVRVNNPTALAFSPDSRHYAAVYTDGLLRVFDAATLMEVKRLRTGTGGFGEIAWNPRRPELLVQTERDLWLVQMGAGTVRKLRSPVGRGAGAWSWDPEGRILACAAEGKGYLWDPESERLLLPQLDLQRPGFETAFDSSGDRLFTRDWSGYWRCFDTRTGRQVLSLQTGGSYGPHFSSAGDRVGLDLTPPKAKLFRYRSGREFRSLSHFDAAQQRRFFEARGIDTTDSTGRLHAVASSDGMTDLADLARLEVAASLPAGGTLGFDRDGALWTCGRQGVLRWPCAFSRDQTRLKIGPPERVYGSKSIDWYSKSADSQVLAVGVAGGTGAYLFHFRSSREFHLKPQGDVRYCAVSPDGRWLATGSHWPKPDSETRIWDAQTARLVKTLPVRAPCQVQFSPDDKWLLTLADRPRLWAAESWQEGPTLPGEANASAAFSSDGKLLALGANPGVVLLLRTDTGAEVARLTAPERTRLKPRCFTKDDAELITVGSESESLHVFDLRAIRLGLAELDLDWEAKPVPPASASGPPPHLKVDVDSGDFGMPPKDRQAYWHRQVAINSVALAFNPLNLPALCARARAFGRLRDHAVAVEARRSLARRALADYRLALALFPPGHPALPAADCARELNNHAWEWAQRPNQPGNPDDALFCARLAVQLDPEHWLYRNTLGVIYYRLRQWQQARENLEMSLLGSAHDAAAFDLFFLAMCHQRLGQPDKARQCFDRAVRWIAEQGGSRPLPRNWVAELAGFRKEAEAVLK